MDIRLSVKGILLLSLASVVFYSCSVKQRSIANNLYEQRGYLLQEFKNKSIIRSRGKNIIMLSYYQNGNVNQFFFKKEKQDFFLSRDTLQYPVNQISSLSGVDMSDSSKYKEAMCKEISILLRKMDTLQIRDISAEFLSVGIDMKIYFGENGALLYISNPDLIKNKRWKDYVTNATRYDSNWYYAKDE